ncbi:MAG: choice-of-anchor D domain-containing protein [Aureispira sp.]|nr:choice-of-anchor D domain-containing protein [Aureispira sp.]
MKRNLHYTTKICLGISLIILFFFNIATVYGQAEIEVLGNIQEITDGDLTPSLLDRTDFEFAIIGGGAKVHTFIVKNTGTADLLINSITGTGDFTTIGALTPSSPISAGDSATFTVTFLPIAAGLSTGSITIDNSDADEAIYDFAVQGVGASSAMGTWDPLLYPPTSCSWTSQDNNATNSPYASWNLAVQDAEAAGTDKVISLQPDAYIGSFDYDNNNGNESCLGHQVATTLDVGAGQNGLQILGSTGGCLTFIDLNSGSGVTHWANFSNMDGLTIKNIYLRDWGKAMNLNNCTNVLIEDCVIESCDGSAINAVQLTGCSNVTFRRCKFLANERSASRAVRVDGSGTAGSRILFEDCDFGCNSTDSEGGALFVGGGSFVQVTRCVFSGNNATASGKGGAINVAIGGDLIVSDADFIDNSVSSSTAVDGGGAIYVDGNSTSIQTTVLIDGCHFYENIANGSVYGGAIGTIGRSGGSNYLFCDVTVQNCIFERNGGARGGAIWSTYTKGTYHNNIFDANQNSSLSGNNSRGGGFYFRSGGGSYVITNNTFLNNLSSSGQIGNNGTGCGTCFPTITGNNYNGQTHSGLANSGGTAGSSLTPASLATAAANYDCSTGSYCAFTLSGSCLSNNQSDYICSPSVANSGSIAGQVWNDMDGNGIQEGADVGITNAYVLLYDESGFLVGRMLTDASGNYSFTGLTAGNYRVVFVNPDISRYPFMSPANAVGSSEPTDSDQASETNINGELRGATSSNVTIVGGSNITDVDAGFTAVDLPVEMVYFKGQKDQNKAVLKWLTETEINNEYFSIQRSTDGISWEEIGRIDGAGTTTVAQHYEWQDDFPNSGINYYRLIQHDFDGRKSASNIVALEFLQNRSVQVYPNPAKDYVLVKADLMLSKIEDIWMTNATGQRISLPYRRINTNLIKVDLSNLEAGVYYLFYSASDNIQYQKFIKQ